MLTRADLFPTHHGAAVKIVRSAEALHAAGDQVVVLSSDRDAYWRLPWTRVPYGPRLRALQEWPLLRDQARAHRLLRRWGYPEAEHGLYEAMVDPAWLLRALYVGLRERVDVWHAEFPGFAPVALAAARLLGGRAVLTQHNVEWDRLRQTTDLDAGRLARIRAVEAAILRRMDAVLALSEPDRARMQAMGAERVAVVPLGVELRAHDGRAIDPRARYGVGSGPLLFFHGTLHYAPNTDAVRWIASVLLPRLPREVAVLVAGPSPLRALESDRLRFTGPVDDLPAHIAAADLCLCPLSAGGGTRLKLLEYFASGKAVVSTPLGAEGLPVASGRELLLAELDAFPDAVLRALNDPALRQRMGQAARRFAAARDWSAVTAAARRVFAGELADFSPRPSVEAHLPPRRPSKPLTLLFLVNRGCNLRCGFCELWQGKEQVPFEPALRLFDEAVAIGTRTVVLTGGEPLLHPRLPELVRSARDRGLAVNVTSNGTLADRHYDALIAAGVGSISLSVDGRAETHDRLRGQTGAHDRTWAQLRRLVGRVPLSVYFTVNRENLGELVAVHTAVRALGVGFDFWPVNDAPALYLRPDQAEAWREAVQALGRVDPEVAEKAHYYGEALGYFAGRQGAVRCLGLVDQYGVRHDGALLPCCVWEGEGLVVGNVFETPLSELWVRPEVQRARERLWREGCRVGCYNHSLYELTRSTGMSHRIDGT